MKSFSRFTVLVGLLAVFLFSAMRLEAADPVVVELHFQNGVKYYKRGLYDRAVEEFEKTLNMEPEHEEAKIYLEKVRLIQKNQTKVEAKASQNAELKQLYEDARKFYAAHKYQETIDTCNKILQIKPIDDFASYYREESEIMISRQLKREKKAQDKERLREARKQAQIDKVQQKEEMRAAREQAKIDQAQQREQLKESRKQAKIDRAEEKERLKEAKRQAKIDRENEKKEKMAERRAAREAARRPVDKTNREAVVQQDLAAYEVESMSRAKPEGETESPADMKMRQRQEKLAQKEQRRQEKLQAKEERKKEKEERRAAKKAAIEERRQAKIDAKVRKALGTEEKTAAPKGSAEERRAAKQARIEAAQDKRTQKQIEAARRKQEAIDRKQDVRVQKALKKETAKQTAQARKDNKELFLKGVDLYGKKKYAEAVAAFESLIEAESQTTGAVYTGTARRLMDKAQQRLTGEGKDKEIESKKN
jgi:hypothetical protein